MSTLKDNIKIMPQDLFTSSATQGTDLGALATTGDGRYFRYVLAGTSALAVGKLQQSAAENASNWENLAIATSAIGATTITTTSTVTLTANALAGGMLTVSAGTGLGYSYKIKSHPAASGAVVTFTLEDAIQVATSSSDSKIDVIPSPYAKVELWDATNHDGTPVGVAVYPITASQYGWIQTGGPCAVLADGSITVGDLVVASNGTDGAVELAVNGSTEAQALVGTAITGISTTEYGSVFLNLN